MTATATAESRLARAATALAAKRYQEAHAHCVAVLQQHGPNAEAFFLLGLLTAAHDNHAKAVEIFDRAIAVNGLDARFQAHRAKSLLALNHRKLAGEAARRAAQLGPPDALTFDTIGVVFTRLGDHAGAIGLFEAAVKQDPARPDYHYNLAASRQFAGDFAAAETAYARTLDLAPGHVRALSAIVGLKRQSEADNRLDALVAAFAARAGDDEDAQLHLGHAIAKTLEDLGRDGEALDWLGRAKAGVRERRGYDSAVDAALFDAAIRGGAGGDPAPGWPSERAVFITGLPRTGTTLVDRILGAHSAIRPVGELSSFALIGKRLAGTPGPYVMDAATLSAASGVAATRWGEAYEDSVADLAGDAPRFTDKMPLNIIWAGQIHRAMPNARIICLRRHPIDACLSNYRQLFATSFSYYNYAYDLEDCARYYLGFDRLRAHWAATLPPDRYTEIAYEDVVADLDGEARRLIAHCGLDWEPACLDFHNQAGSVATASSVQVRQPLYSSSIGRWKRHAEALRPMRAILEEGGVIDANGHWLREA
ncbi:tetratricopeptide repeat-containing sulfotransferase family protein [Maricaulis sp.]|uniref:tetratricopeptide repeat-containing sulfotransferase family protein n=1 Tax=Maricaulis sp. TaxID=1486257 RepID=UPI0025C3E0ED|nr:tetratricopeptide repeat-containing sulfotransferase family protein [Maricaulis sp.]